jgi:hypothetical protein
MERIQSYTDIRKVEALRSKKMKFIPNNELPFYYSQKQLLKQKSLPLIVTRNIESYLTNICHPTAFVMKCFLKNREIAGDTYDDTVYHPILAIGHISKMILDPYMDESKICLKTLVEWCSNPSEMESDPMDYSLEMTPSKISLYENLITIIEEHKKNKDFRYIQPTYNR